MLTHWRHTRPHHFSIVQTPPMLAGRRVCVPELLAPFFSHGLPVALAPKAISRWGDDVELSCELVMQDASLLEDLRAKAMLNKSPQCGAPCMGMGCKAQTAAIPGVSRGFATQQTAPDRDATCAGTCSALP